MASKQCLARLQKEYRAILKEPVPHCQIHPSPASLLEWIFVLEGVENTPYAGGYYMGKIVFPPQFPFKPPSISMMTPSGRFAVNQHLCMSMTNYHPESWSPMWSVSTILCAFLSFFNEEGQVSTGSITTTKAEKVALAASSLDHNMKSPMFRKLFPDLVELHARRQQQQQEQKVLQQRGMQGTAMDPSQPATSEPAEQRGTAKYVFTSVIASLVAIVIAVGLIGSVERE